MLAYLDDVPVLGATGCARSRKVNVIDWILPRLLAGDAPGLADIAVLGAIKNACNAERSVRLDSGDLVVLYSDGITEA
jgi:hypothetical protein